MKPELVDIESEAPTVGHDQSTTLVHFIPRRLDVTLGVDHVHHERRVRQVDDGGTQLIVPNVLRRSAVIEKRVPVDAGEGSLGRCYPPEEVTSQITIESTPDDHMHLLAGFEQRHVAPWNEVGER